MTSFIMRNVLPAARDVRTETADGGTQRYHVVLPKGVAAPLAHVEPATVNIAPKKAAALKR